MFASKNMLQISVMVKSAEHRLPFIFTIYFDKVTLVARTGSKNEELCFRRENICVEFPRNFPITDKM